MVTLKILNQAVKQNIPLRIAEENLKLSIEEEQKEKEHNNLICCRGCYKIGFNQGKTEANALWEKKINEVIDKVFNKEIHPKTWKWDTDKDVEQGINLANYHIKKQQDNVKELKQALLGNSESKHKANKN